MPDRGRRKQLRLAAIAQAESGQAVIVLVGVLALVLVGAVVLGGVARGVGKRGREQRAADLAALAGARAMHTVYPRLFEPPIVAGDRNERHLDRAGYLNAGRTTALETARRNGAKAVEVSFPDRGSFAPVRVRVVVRDPIKVGKGGAGHELPVKAVAVAELAPDPGTAAPPLASGGGYGGPLAYRQGKPMRPDVALAFDRMQRAARADGIALIVVSGYRSDAEQARLFAQHPDPKWVAPPGKSLHHLGTELDLGPPSAYPWLQANARRFGFVQRYAWEKWHYETPLAQYGLGRRYAVCGWRIARNQTARMA